MAIAITDFPSAGKAAIALVESIPAEEAGLSQSTPERQP
jgi:hypothetical protein